MGTKLLLIARHLRADTLYVAGFYRRYLPIAQDSFRRESSKATDPCPHISQFSAGSPKKVGIK